MKVIMQILCYLFHIDVLYALQDCRDIINVLHI